MAAKRAIAKAATSPFPLMSAQAVLHGEKLADFEALHAKFQASYQPLGMAEYALVHDQAVLTWKKLGMMRLETAVFARTLDAPVTDEEIEQYFGTVGQVPSEIRDRLIPFRRVSNSELNAIGQIMADYHGLKADELVGQDYHSAMARWPYLFKALLKQAAQNNWDVKFPTSAPTAALLFAMSGRLCNQFQAVCWMQLRQDQLDFIVKQVLDSRLLAVLPGNIAQSSIAQIDTAIYRNMTELRKEQGWRMRRVD